MRTLSKTHVLVLVIGLLLPTVLLAEMKIGYVDSNKLMAEYEGAREAQIELEKESRKMEAAFENLLFQIDSLKQDFEKQKLLMSEDRRQKKGKEITNLETQAQEFQMKKFGPEGEIYRKQSQLLAPVLEKIQVALESVGKERGYDYILDALSGAILYALPQHDLTDEVLEELKKMSTSGEN